MSLFKLITSISMVGLLAAPAIFAQTGSNGWNTSYNSKGQRTVFKPFKVEKKKPNADFELMKKWSEESKAAEEFTVKEFDPVNGVVQSKENPYKVDPSTIYHLKAPVKMEYRYKDSGDSEDVEDKSVEVPFLEGSEFRIMEGQSIDSEDFQVEIVKSKMQLYPLQKNGKYFISANYLDSANYVQSKKTATLPWENYFSQLGSINSQLQAPQSNGCCEGEFFYNSSLMFPTVIGAPSAADGARKVMATLFQDCSALNYKAEADYDLIYPAKVVGIKQGSYRKLTKSNRDPYIEGHYLLKHLKEASALGAYPKPGCTNILDKPPVYSFNAKAEHDEANKILRISEDLSKKTNGCGGNGTSCSSLPVTGFDCSGFVSAAFQSAGLRFTPTMDVASTASIKSATSKSGCFDSVKLIPDAIKEGDLVNWVGSGKSRHMFLIEKVGPDPLGIQKVLDDPAGNCASISEKDFNFTIAHSGSAPNSIGPSLVDAKYFENNYMTPMASIVATARATCNQMKKNKNLTTPKQNIGTVSIKGSFSIVRHKGAAKAGCVVPQNERYKLEGEDCVKACTF